MKSNQQMTMDVHEKVGKENGLSEVVSADPQSCLDHKDAPSCGEIDLLPPIKKIKSRKRKRKQQITVDSHERVEKENDSSEGTPLVVDTKSRKRKPKKQITTAVNPAETSNLVDEDLHVNMEKMTQKQNITELVSPGSSNLLKEASLSALQDLNVRQKARKRNGSHDSANVGNPDANNISAAAAAPTSDLQDNVSRKKRKKNRKGEQNSANLVNTETSNMSTAALTSVLQRLNENSGPSDESKGLMLREKARKRNGSLDSANVGNPDANNISAVAPTSDLQDNVSRKKKKRNRKGEQKSANLVNPETSNMSAAAPTTVLQRLNENVRSSDESKCLMLLKDGCLVHSSNLAIPEASNVPGVVPTFDLQENVNGKDRKRIKKRRQSSANLVSPETSTTVAPTSVLKALNGNICLSDESKGLMPSKDDCLKHSSNVVNPVSSKMPSVVPTLDLQEKEGGKKSKRKRERGKNSANLDNPEIGNMSTVAQTSVLQGLNENIGPSDESKGLMLPKDDCLMHSSNLVNLEVSDIPGVGPTSDLQENVRGKRRKRNRKQEQNSANLVNHEASSMSTVATVVLQGLNGNIDPSDESKSLMLSKNDRLMHSSNLVIPEASSMPVVAPISDSQENVSGKKRKSNRKRGQLSANVVNSETSNLSNVPLPLGSQEINGNTSTLDESRSLMLSKDKPLLPVNLVNPEASNMSSITPTSVLQENLSGKKKKRKRNREQHPTNLVNPETNDLQGSNGDIAPDSESKFCMPSKDELLMNDTVTKTDMPQHVPNSSSLISSAKVLTKKLLILDLNGLLADIVPYTNKIRKHDLVLSKKYVYKRPYVDEFLEFCLERFTVAVWSSRKKWNIDPLIKFLIGTDRSKLLFCLDQYHCTTTTFTTIDGTKKPLVLKDLRKVWDNSFKDPKCGVLYNESNTLLLDDSPYKALINPANTAIFPHSYNYSQVDDNALGPGGDLQIYLEGLSLAENVQEYVKNNPFGQSAITQSHPSWEFYRAVKDRYGHCVDSLKELGNLPRVCRTSYTDASKRCSRASGSFREQNV